jgi:hypothetical protein
VTYPVPGGVVRYVDPVAAHAESLRDKLAALDHATTPDEWLLAQFDLFGKPVLTSVGTTRRMFDLYDDHPEDGCVLDEHARCSRWSTPAVWNAFYVRPA